MEEQDSKSTVYIRALHLTISILYSKPKNTEILKLNAYTHTRIMGMKQNQYEKPYTCEMVFKQKCNQFRSADFSFSVFFAAAALFSVILNDRFTLCCCVVGGEFLCVYLPESLVRIMPIIMLLGDPYI